MSNPVLCLACATDTPHRSSGVKCDVCRRVFAAGHVPAPNVRGVLVCRDCEEQAMREGLPLFEGP